MKAKTFFFIIGIATIVISFTLGNGWCKLKPLDDTELSAIDAEGVNVHAVSNQTVTDKNGNSLPAASNDSGGTDINNSNDIITLYSSVPAPHYNFYRSGGCGSGK